ncbi:GmrSD restriction endonuclease domain-containing protein [Onishia taeanensis]|uniref:GmrSD restriction endonuclease domain-containing protein n=1 Tax=Onishia taeanensis TaxID=284577 RepID=UPI003C7D41F9
MTTFDSTKRSLPELLKDITTGKIQLPDFQRGWVWDDDHVKSLLVSIARSFPVGAVMLMETGGEVRFQTRPVVNANEG